MLLMLSYLVTRATDRHQLFQRKKGFELGILKNTILTQKN